MSSLAMPQAAQRRYARFFHGTMRDPLFAADDHDHHASARIERAPNSALEIEALRVIRSNLQAKALTQGGLKLSEAQLGAMLQAAQHTLRGMTDDQLKAVASSGSALETIVATSFNAVPITDATHRAALEAAALAGDTGTRDSASQLARLEFMRTGMSSAERSREMGAERLSTADRALVASATAEAMRLGMPWALNNPELLRLGPSAIKTLHEAGVQRERFERMVSDKVGFRASTAVAIAAYAKRNNLTPEETNRLFDKINHGAEVVSGGNREIQRELDEATRRYATGPDTPEARRELEEAWRRHADTPEKKKAAEEAARALIKPWEINTQAAAKQTAAVAQRDADRTATDQKLDDLDAIASAATAAPQIKSAEQKQDDKKLAVKTPTPTGPKPT